MTVAAAVMPAPGLSGSASAPVPGLEWIVSTQGASWKPQQGAQLASMSTGDPDIYVNAQARAQTIEGFGACFNEQGWDALAQLRPAERESVFAELFGADGARFTLCRMPVGANDFSRDWYPQIGRWSSMADEATTA
jgi:glucosylceramidase